MREFQNLFSDTLNFKKKWQYQGFYHSPGEGICTGVTVADLAQIVRSFRMVYHSHFPEDCVPEIYDIQKR